VQVQTSVKTERNYGIDLLRLISMLYVLVLHALGRGGLLDHTQRLSVQYQFGWFMQLWALCAVDIFALISGYVGYTEKIKKYNYANLHNYTESKGFDVLKYRYQTVNYKNM
jgi:surface polysaccharide O-acyltransferase-like enzyme